QVRAGDVLAEIASLELENLQLKLLESHLRIGLLEDTLGRLGKLDDVQVLARRRLWETESQYKAALDQRDSLRRQLEILGLSRRQLERLLGEQRLVEALPIRSPIDGVVVAFDRALGEAVGEREALLEIHDLSRVWVQGHVSERDLARIRIDEQSPQQARVRFSAYPGLVVEGIVRRSGQLLGSQDRTLAVWIELSGTPAELLHHNMLARVAMVVDQTSPVLAVPHEAVVREGTRAFVFVQKRDGTFQRRRVQPGRRDDRYQEIVAGLSGGEVIAVRAAAQLQTAYASLR
ncbi:MAG: efflux RND transporter periplasmic adaptor subunit, partial [Phycisphaeraceae bacterium]